jgi:hypothetical protein
MRWLFIWIFAFCLAFGAPQYESMSNEELIALIGYVKPQEEPKFMQVLESRKPTFTPKEKAQYERNLAKVKK